MEKKQKSFEDVKKEIRSLLLSSPVGLRLQDLVADYRAMIGVHLPFQEFGYSSAAELIKHIPDVVYPVFRAGGVMYLEAVSDATTAHIKKLVLQQKKSGKISRIRKPPDESVRRPPSKPVVPAVIRMKLKDLLRNHPNGLESSMFGTEYKKLFGVDLNIGRLGFPTLKKLLEECSEIINIVNKNVNGQNAVVLYLKKENEIKNLPSTEKRTNPVGNRIIKEKDKNSANIAKAASQPLLQKKINVSSSNILAKKEKPRLSGKLSSPPKKPTNPSLMDLEPEFNVASKDTSSSDKKRPGITTQSGISDQLKSEIQELIEGKQNGMWLARLPFEYKRVYKKELDTNAAGYFSLITLVGSIPDVVKIERPVKNGDWLLLPVVQGKDVGLEDPLPKDAVKYDGNYQKMAHPTEGQIEVFIVQINNPGSFFFHWCKKKAALDKLMDEISNFYKSVASQSYLLPQSHRKIGQVCCTIYDDDGEWYRAIIIKIFEHGEEVEVLFTDYGDKAVVPACNLRFLKNDFIELPAMCIRGSLANIKPVSGNSWPQEAANRFFDLTKDKVLLGKVHRFENDVLDLELVDTNYNKKIHINDSLVIERLASYKSIPAPIQIPSQRMGFNPTILQQPVSPVSPVSPLFQSTPFANFGMNMEALQQQLAFLNPLLASNMLFYPTLQQTQQLLQLQQNQIFQQQLRPLQMTNAGNIAQPVHHAASDSQLNSSYSNAVKKVPERQDSAPDVSYPLRRSSSSSIDSLIECINSELDLKGSSDEADPDSTSSDFVPAKSISDAPLCDDSVDDEQSEVCIDEEEKRPRYVTKIKKLKVPEPYTLHVVKYDDKAYVTRGEISALLWHNDILRQRLRQQKVVVPFIVIPREENTELFEDLTNENIKDLVEEQTFKECLTLYELESLPNILDVFKHKSEELKKIIKDEIDQLKSFPENYWEDSASNSGSDDDIAEDSMAFELELEELRLLLQAMQFRRKRLVNSLMSKASSPETVDEIKRVEEEVEKIRKKITAKEGRVC